MSNKVAKKAIAPAPGKPKSGIFDMLQSIGKAESEDGSIKVAVGDIEPDPEQPRTDFEAERIENLAASIGQYGVLQPLTVLRTGAIPPYRIIAGERRWRAAQLAGLAEVPVFVRDDLGEDLEKLAVAQLIENTNRADLSDYELAKAIQLRIVTSPDPNRLGLKTDIARMLDRKQADISRLLSMLDPEWLPLIEEGLIVSADALSRFRSLSEDMRASLIAAARESGEPITSGMIRALKAAPAVQAAAPQVASTEAGQAVAASAGDRSDRSSSDPDATGVGGLGSSAGAAGAGDPDAGGLGDDDDDAGAAGEGDPDAGGTGGLGDDDNAGAAGEGDPNAGGTGDPDDDDDNAGGGGAPAARSHDAGGASGSSTPRNKAVSLNATGEDLEALVRYLVDKSADKLEVRIPHDLAVAVIENLGGTTSDVPPETFGPVIRQLLDVKLGKF